MAVPVNRGDATQWPVRRWEPMRELEELQQETAQLIESVFPGRRQSSRQCVGATRLHRRAQQRVIAGLGRVDLAPVESHHLPAAGASASPNRKRQTVGSCPSSR